jgi:hypothetical protein
VDPGDPRLRAAFEALAEAVRAGRIRKVALERIDGEPCSAVRSATCWWSWASGNLRAR